MNEVKGYTPQEVAVYFDCSDRTIRNYIYRGKVPAINISRGKKNARWRVTSFKYLRKVL